MLTLLTGPVRSGKSTFALELARESGRDPVYVATAAIDPADAEMTARVARHRAERGSMRTIETNEASAPRLADVLRTSAPGEILLIDSLGTWLSSHLITEADIAVHANELLEAFAATKSDAIIVAEETGWGVVPPSVLGRRFRDELGRLTATLAGRVDRVYLVVAGYAVDVRAVGRRITAW